MKVFRFNVEHDPEQLVHVVRGLSHISEGYIGLECALPGHVLPRSAYLRRGTQYDGRYAWVTCPACRASMEKRVAAVPDRVVEVIRETALRERTGNEED